MEAEITDSTQKGTWTFDRMDHKEDLGIKITKTQEGLQVYILKEGRSTREEILITLPPNAIKSLTAWLKDQEEQ